MLNLQSASGFDSFVRVNQRQKKEKAGFWVVLSHGAYRECGILPGEEMVLAVSTESVISRDYIPSGKQVRRAREKRLITVFHEAMSRVANRSRRVYRADDMRHKSGRGMRCAGQKLGYGFKVCTNLHVYLRTTAIPRCALHTRYTNPLHE